MDSNKTFNISMPKALLEAVDKQAEVEFRNRSDLIREAVRTYIAQQGGMNVANKLTKTEKERVAASFEFADFTSQPAISLSSTFRPQPNSVHDIFASGSDVVKLIEHPPKMRSMGFDLDTLDRARPVAGEYLEVANGRGKLLRLYRDGQITFSGGLDFFGHGVNNAIEHPHFNLLAVAEVITNFVDLSKTISSNLEKGGGSSIFTITVSNPNQASPDKSGVNKLSLSAYDGVFTTPAGDLTLDRAERDIVIHDEDNLSVDRIAYLIYSEFCYFFGTRSDELWYVTKAGEINRDVFLKAGK